MGWRNAYHVADPHSHSRSLQLRRDFVGFSGPAQTITPHPYRFYCHHDSDYGYHVADRTAIPGRAAWAGFRRLLREAAAAKAAEISSLPNLASRQLAPFRGAVEGRNRAPARYVVFRSPYPDQGLIHRPTNGGHCGGDSSMLRLLAAVARTNWREPRRMIPRLAHAVLFEQLIVV
jgi:hypothetical protein